MDRVLEPELMTGEDQALAYAKPEFAEVNQGFVDRFRACFPKAAGGAMVDLGCGPGGLACELTSDRHWIVRGRLPRGTRKGPPP